MLLERADVGVVEGVRRAVALQAQEPASPYLALWNRIQDFDPASLDSALAAGWVVKASLMRITLHAVASRDYHTFHEAVLPLLRASRLHDRRFEATGLAPQDADELLPALLELGAAPFGRAEAEAALHLDAETAKWAWWAIRTFGPFHHAPGDATWAFGPRPSYRAAPVGDRPPHDAALRSLARRYLEGFGPARPEDFSQFTLHKRSTSRRVFDELEDVVVLDGPDGPLYDVPGGPLPSGDTPAPPRLLGMWDSVLFAYADRSRVIPDEYRPHVIRRNGDTLPTLLVDGRVAGVWRPVDGRLEVTAFHSLDEGVWRALEPEGQSLLALVRRDPALYERYSRWWDLLPDGDVRLVG
jgi:hypothetical protein